MDKGNFWRDYLAMAARAATIALMEEDEEETEQRKTLEEGMSRLTRAIKRFWEVYERVEVEKMRQMVELEKQRMQFCKELEVQYMHTFMRTQVQLERIKRGKKLTPNDI